MMGSNRNLSVGLFVLAALIFMAVFTVWITGKKGGQANSQYSIMIKNDVSGLSLGGPVYFLGVAVGEVTELSIVSGDPPAIRVDIEVQESTPINSGSRATLAAQGITGVSVINLSSEHGAHPPLPVTPGFEYPLIPFKDSGFAAILSSAPQVLEKIETLLDRANNLLDDTNQTAVRQALANVEHMTASLASTESGLQQLPASLQATLADVQATSTELRKLLQGAGPGLQVSISNIEQATGQLAGVTHRLDSWLLEHDDEVRQFMGDGLGEVPGLVNDARSALRELDKLLEQLRRDPSTLIYRPERDSVPVED
jgi:phospholipid/cholesterol/gamma-HCH transport system substrate-binding protein